MIEKYQKTYVIKKNFILENYIYIFKKSLKKFSLLLILNKNMWKIREFSKNFL